MTRVDARTAVPGPPVGERGPASSADAHFVTLDGLRAVAALSILVFHVASSEGLVRLDGAHWLFNGGQVGVPVFFVLSGFLLYRPWARSLLEGAAAPRVGAYFRKRALRILPAYWVLVVCFMLTAGRAHVAEPQTWLPLLTLTHTYHPSSWWGTDIGPRHLGQIWTLAVEAAWYVVLPLVAAVLARSARHLNGVDARAKRLLWGIGALGAISPLYTVASYVPSHHGPMDLWLPRYTAWFALGMALAVLAMWAAQDPDGPLARRCRTVTASWAACWLGAACLFVIAATPLTGPLDLGTSTAFWSAQARIVVYGLCALALVAPLALAPREHPALTSILGNRVMRFLGRVSYGIFLWQMILIVAWFDHSGRPFGGSLVADLLVVLAATLAAATLSFYLVERPLQRLGRRRAVPADRTVGTG